MNFLNVLCKILLGFCLDNQFGILFYTLHDTSFWHHLFCWKSPCFFQHKPFHRYSRIFLFRISFHCQEIEFGIRQLLPDAFAVQNYLLEAKLILKQKKYNHLSLQHLRLCIDNQKIIVLLLQWAPCFTPCNGLLHKDRSLQKAIHTFFV